MRVGGEENFRGGDFRRHTVQNLIEQNISTIEDARFSFVACFSPLVQRPTPEASLRLPSEAET